VHAEVNTRHQNALLRLAEDLAGALARHGPRSRGLDLPAALAPPGLPSRTPSVPRGTFGDRPVVKAARRAESLPAPRVRARFESGDYDTLEVDPSDRLAS
jgi:hypothetical protein